MKRLVEYLGCGRLIYTPARDSCDIRVSSFSNIVDIIIPFLDKYPIQGEKSLDYACLQKAADIMKAKGHLTPEGLEQIREIKSGMNTKRNVA